MCFCLLKSFQATLIIIDKSIRFIRFKIIVKIEKDGMAFYQDLMGMTNNEKTREALQILIQEEEKHLKFFEDTLFDLRENEWFEKEDDILDEMEYGIFPDPSHEVEESRGFRPRRVKRPSEIADRHGQPGQVGGARRKPGQRVERCPGRGVADQP